MVNALRPGQVLSHYEIVQEIGSGAFATVYTCFDQRDYPACASTPKPEAAPYVLKMVLKQGLDDEQLELSRLEAEIHHQLPAHAHLVQLREWFEDAMALYLVMQRCEHGDLYDLLRRAPKGKSMGSKDNGGSLGLPAPWIRRYMLQIIDALMMCHLVGVYHRDLKPENILLHGYVGVDGYPSDALLGDFGLATRNSFSTELGLGTRSYLAPECLDESIDGYLSGPADVFALALVALQMTFPGLKLWESTAVDDRDYASFCEACSGSPSMAATKLKQWFSTRFPQVSSKFQYFLARTLHPNPSRRATLAEVRQMIEQIDQFSCTRTPSLLVTNLPGSGCNPQVRYSPMKLAQVHESASQEMVKTIPTFQTRSEESTRSDISDMDFNDVMGVNSSSDCTSWETSPCESMVTTECNSPVVMANPAATRTIPIPDSKASKWDRLEGIPSTSLSAALFQSFKKHEPTQAPVTKFSSPALQTLSQIDWAELDDEEDEPFLRATEASPAFDWIVPETPMSQWHPNPVRLLKPTLLAHVPKKRQGSIDSAIGTSYFADPTSFMDPIHELSSRMDDQLTI